MLRLLYNINKQKQIWIIYSELCLMSSKC